MSVRSLRYRRCSPPHRKRFSIAGDQENSIPDCDGTNLIPLNSPTLPVMIPPAYGLQGVGFETYTGDGPISYWNSYVGVSQMGGQGNFSDPRIGLTITQNPDLVTSKLSALSDYQLGL